MLIKTRHVLLGAVILLALVLAGCSSNSTAPTTNGGNNLTDSFGGYKATDESPAFGDTAIANMTGGMDAEDEMGGTPLVDSLRQPARADVYSVQLAWGHLQYDSLEAVVTDWSGSLSIRRGAIVALRLIGFEAGDRIVRPRGFAKELRWISHTKEYYDGLLVYVYDPLSDSSTTPNTLTFSTGPYSQTWNVSDLDSLSDVVDVGANQFSINALKVEPQGCGEGYLDGRWMRNGFARSGGEFLGRWISKDGILMGHFRGFFGVRDDSSHVLFGKWISAGPPGDDFAPGAFRGLLRGTWDFAPASGADSSAGGNFSGEIYDRTLSVIGQFSGSWVAAGVADSTGMGIGNGHMGGEGEHHIRGMGHGFMRGDWSKNCNQ